MVTAMVLTMTVKEVTAVASWRHGVNTGTGRMWAEDKERRGQRARPWTGRRGRHAGERHAPEVWDTGVGRASGRCSTSSIYLRGRTLEILY